MEQNKWLQICNAIIHFKGVKITEKKKKGKPVGPSKMQILNNMSLAKPCDAFSLSSASKETVDTEPTISHTSLIS